ncbi:hypothetical protein [Sandaracinus amylolyticus]|uniref:Uncharacterized protein n=1 Tax=Sandaracinus amylolyticus TaxID=927083 RepID=A0A0F6W9V9_9BACT|nr:hypothetical protein [Sandaracinus amylolyticus]AKF11105.1 hypothetical protein DB32_008254 [Sandaracinus amylolyticus]
MTLRRWEKKAFGALLGLSARAARAPVVRVAVPSFMRALAALTRRVRRPEVDEGDAASLGRAWQRYMPSPHLVPSTRVEGGTAYHEIRMRCPLRGSGDLAACHRLMAYDRALMAEHGARFVVLRPQAEPGVEVCEIAIRAASWPHDDLVPAHRLVRGA